LWGDWLAWSYQSFLEMYEAKKKRKERHRMAALKTMFAFMKD
jgi:hypothetical protein